MDDETDDETDGWKGRRPPSQPDKTKDIIYKDVYCQILLFSFQQQVCAESHLVELIGLFLCFFITIRVDHSGSFEHLLLVVGHSTSQEKQF